MILKVFKLLWKGSMWELNVQTRVSPRRIYYQIMQVLISSPTISAATTK
jgi:hypothetical protein